MATALDEIDRQVVIQSNAQDERRQIIGQIVTSAERSGKRVNVPACVVYIKTGRNKGRLTYDLDEVK